MSKRGDIARKKILEASRRLFAHRGYSAVTMQDICNLLGISRGGLYRHYSGTEAIFAAIITDEQAQALEALENAKKQGLRAKVILDHFVQSRVSIIFDENLCIENAISEYALNSQNGKALLKTRAENSVSILTDLIQLGNAQGDFSCSQPEALALQINFILEGMSKHHALLPLSVNQANAQLQLIEQLLKN